MKGIRELLKGAQFTQFKSKTAIDDKKTEIKSSGLCEKMTEKREGKRKVICMEDLRSIKTDSLEVEENTIFTPLAKDYIKDKGIKVVFRRHH